MDAPLPTRYFESTPSMTKPEIIERIRSHNRSADAAFLARFPEPALIAYLGRLDRLSNRRGDASRWVRRAPRFAAAAIQPPLFKQAA
ncbi:MAG: hypothetical protein AAGH92_00460 [Planctomycetota bacterium]